MKPAKPKLSQAEAKPKAILSAAIKIFTKQGFKTASMDEIAEKAKVSKITIYKHFGNKEQLFQAVLAEHWNNLLVINDQLFDDHKSITINLKNFAHYFMVFLYHPETIDLFRLLISEANQFPHLIEKLLINGKPPFTRQLIEYLEKKNKDGDLEINNPERAASYFLGLLKEYHFWPMMLGFAKKKMPSQQNKLIEEAVNIFLMAYQK